MGQSTIGMLSLKTILLIFLKKNKKKKKKKKKKQLIFLRKISKNYFQSPTHSVSCIQNSKKLITKQQNEVNFWWKIENIV